MGFRAELTRGGAGGDSWLCPLFIAGGAIRREGGLHFKWGLQGHMSKPVEEGWPRGGALVASFAGRVFS